jgi:hypothetical protein
MIKFRRIDGVLYPTGAEKSFLIKIPTDKRCANHESLDLTSLFPNGSISFRLSELPGTAIPLYSDVRIYVDNHFKAAPMNLSIFRMYGIPWHGNIAVFHYKPIPRFSKGRPPQYQHVHRTDINNGVNLIMALSVSLRPLLPHHHC